MTLLQLKKEVLRLYPDCSIHEFSAVIDWTGNYKIRSFMKTGESADFSYIEGATTEQFLANVQAASNPVDVTVELEEPDPFTGLPPDEQPSSAKVYVVSPENWIKGDLGEYTAVPPQKPAVPRLEPEPRETTQNSPD